MNDLTALVWPKLRSRFQLHSTCRSFCQGLRRWCVRRQQCLASMDSVCYWSKCHLHFLLTCDVTCRIYFGFLVRLPCDTKTSGFPSKHTISQPQVNLLTATPVRKSPSASRSRPADNILDVHESIFVADCSDRFFGRLSAHSLSSPPRSRLLALTQQTVARTHRKV